jgi:multidrug resistance protein
MTKPTTESATTEVDEAELELEKKISHQAVDEGHDADLPSSEGFIRTGGTHRDERKRRKSDVARRDMTANGQDRDVEKEADEAPATPSEDGPDDDQDPNVVWWDDNDPDYPYNWPRGKTLVNCLLISAMCFITPLASCKCNLPPSRARLCMSSGSCCLDTDHQPVHTAIFAPSVPQLMREFGSSSLEMAAFVVSVYILGFAFGPLLMAPLSEIYGRVVVYHACNVGFIAFLVACALAPTLNALVAFRFLSGIFGACPVTNGGGSIADMVRQESRALAMAGFSVGPLLGPIIGPIAGGFLADAKGWRWNFWVLAIAAGFLSLVMLVILRETYHPVLLQRKVDRLRSETGNEALRSKLNAGLSPSDYFKRGIIRPLRLIMRSPLVSSLSLYTALTYGYLYVMFTSMTEVFEEYYGFSTSLVGLAYIGLGVGSLLGVFLYSGTSDRYMKRKAAEADAAAEASGVAREGMKPEYRLPMLPFGAALLPIGLFIYGWTAEYRVHWIAPIVGTALIGGGNMMMMMAIQIYLIDAFTIYAASAIAANTVIRSIAGAVLPLAGLKMYARLGIGWGNSLLGFIALVLIPVSFYVIRYGERIRKRYVLKDL